ncbi:MAG: hypothetical protein ACI841_002768 [Planctomycetota bacterium]|jgi:hypothetical protein
MRRTLLIAMALQTLTITVMAIAIHPLLAPILLLRSVPQAIMGPLVSTAVLERVPSATSATYLSIQSLAGRLAFSASMFIASLVIGITESITQEAMSTILAGFALCALVSLVGLPLWPASLTPAGEHRTQGS